MVHAENSDCIEWFTKDLEARGMTEPWHHGTSRPPIVEAEATNRILALSELMDCPVLFVHVSVPGAIQVIRQAQTKLLSVYAETCPHYMLLTADAMRAPGFEGAKACCAPPLREDPCDRERIFEGLLNGTLTIYSSDHAPTNYYDSDGKQVCIPRISLRALSRQDVLMLKRVLSLDLPRILAVIRVEISVTSPTVCQG